MILTEPDRAIVMQAREILAGYISHNPILSSWDAVIDYLHCAMPDRSVEHFHVLYLDRKNRLIEDHHAGTGTVDHVPVYPREVAAQALRVGASALVLAHNHPTGELAAEPY